MHITLSPRWSEHYPRAGVGVLAITGLQNPKSDAELERTKGELEASLRQRYLAGGKAAIRALPVMQSYAAYYRKFGKSYHVQLQTESVVLQGKSLPSVSALVDTMFIAELKNGLLTAGHDLDAVHPPLIIDVAHGEKSYTMMNGKEQTLKTGDMCMCDTVGVISSVLYGPDARTRISATTTSALFVVYAPEGISRNLVLQHLTEIQVSSQRIAPSGQITLLDFFGFSDLLRPPHQSP
ncbi:MAG: phenylalanine--tRNA ligase beta subunit-related protein [Anaerolineales bacterium]